MRLIQILLQKGATLLIIMVGKGNIAGRSGRGECLVLSLRGEERQNLEAKSVLGEEICGGPPGVLAFFCQNKILEQGERRMAGQELFVCFDAKGGRGGSSF